MLDLATLAALHEKYREDLAVPVADFALGPHRFESSRQTYLMGVVNLSADSWYRESVALSAEAAVRRGRVLAEQGTAWFVVVGHSKELLGAQSISVFSLASRRTQLAFGFGCAGHGVRLLGLEQERCWPFR